MSGPVYRCGHERAGHNRLFFKNGRYRGDRCRICHRDYQAARQGAGRRAVEWVIDLLNEGLLSEGQVAARLELDRMIIRELADLRREDAA